MTEAVIVGGLILLVIGAFSWARISAAWNDRRSIDSYGHALGVLGDVARRSDSTGNVRIVPRDSAGGGHVKADGAEGGLPPPRAPGRDRSPEREPSVAGGPEGSSALDLRASASSPAAPSAAPLGLQVRASVAASPATGLGQRTVLTVLPEQRGPIADQVRPADSGNEPTLAIRPVHDVPRVSIPVPARPWRFEDDAIEWAQPEEPAGGILPKAGRAFTDMSEVTDLSAMRQARTRPARPFEPAPSEATPYEPARYGKAPYDRAPHSAARREPASYGSAPSEADWYESEEPVSVRAGGPAISLHELRRQATVRRLATGAAAVVAVVLAIVAVMQLTGGSDHPASGHPPRPRPAPPAGAHSTGGTVRKAGSGGHATVNPAGSTGKGSSVKGGVASDLPGKLVPTSATAGVVSFRVHSRRYLLTFSDTGAGPCWIGVSAAVGSAWLWYEVLQPGTTTSYAATGPAVVNLGAPNNIAVKVNGITAQLPDSASSYDLSFSKKGVAAST